MNLKYMELAYKEALKAYKHDEVPVGAIIVKNGTIISKSYNKKEKEQCCTYHAEILAIQKACRKIRNWRLDGCDIYITLEPCPMCASAIKQARIENVYCGLNNSDINNEVIIKKIFKADNNNSEVIFFNNLYVEKVKLLMQSFFNKRRKK